MVLAGMGLGCVAVIPRNDSAQTLFPLDLAFGCRRKAWSENLVPNIRTLMRAFVVVVRQPFAVDMVELFQRDTDKVVQTFPFSFANIAFDKCICFGSLNRRFKDFCSRTFPETIKLGRIFKIPIVDQMRGFNAKILQPHRRIASLLKNPISGRAEGRRAHKSVQPVRFRSE